MSSKTRVVTNIDEVTPEAPEVTSSWGGAISIRNVDGTKMLTGVSEIVIDESSGIELVIDEVTNAASIKLKAGFGVAAPIRSFEFTEPSSKWEVIHNMNSSALEERVRVWRDTGVYELVLAPTEILDENRFVVKFTHPVVGRVDVRFGQ